MALIPCAGRARGRFRGVRSVRTSAVASALDLVADRNTSTVGLTADGVLHGITVSCCCCGALFVARACCIGVVSCCGFISTGRDWRHSHSTRSVGVVTEWGI